MVTGGALRFVVVGDTTLDVTVRADEAPMAGGDVAARIAIGPGGQGANLAVRLARRGGSVRLVTAIGDDAAGSLVRAALAADQVDLVPLGAARTGVVVALVNANGERAMLSDRVPFEPRALAAAEAGGALAGAEWVHVSGYPLADERSGETLATVVAARPEPARCSVGGGSFATGAGLDGRIARARPDLLLFDRREAAALVHGAAPAVDPEPAVLLAAELAARYRALAVITDGPAGAVAAAGEVMVRVPAPTGAVVLDATGAGDAHAAGVLWALAGGPWPPPADELRNALETGARWGAETASRIGAQAPIVSEDSG